MYVWFYNSQMTLKIVWNNYQNLSSFDVSSLYIAYIDMAHCLLFAEFFYIHLNNDTLILLVLEVITIILGKT